MTQFPLARGSDIWLAKFGTQCAKFKGTTSTVETGPCNMTEKLRYFCQQREYISTGELGSTNDLTTATYMKCLVSKVPTPYSTGYGSCFES